LEEIDTIVREEDTSRSEMIRAVVSKYLREKGAPSAGSAHRGPEEGAPYTPYRVVRIEV